jgi:hypothetical protein
MSQGKRYKFNGSKFTVQTGLAVDTPPQAITAITNANPGEVTSASHGLVPGSVAKLAAIVGMVNLNDLLVVPDNIDANTFELSGIDTSDYPAYVSGGTIREVTFSEMCELTGANQQDGAADQTDVSTICSTAKEFEQGLADSGTLQLDFNYAPLETTQAALKAARSSGDAVAFKVAFPKAGGIVIMFGTVQQTSFTGQNGGVWTGSATIKLTGDIFVLEGGA